ncbi:sorting nexin-22 isoform X2 [Rhinopithecus roxellana]|uniref:sorting nexin-22 isoform X2 n=1 Tax=Rhinopithecus roxellana TaxID=61622 RepID=UPI00123723B4|nr:sorting nexin-22 isoform X2 [Rhinopithecus roxellana]
MLEVHIPSVGPEAEGPRQSPEKGHMVFQVEVLCSGRRHTVPRRYSEFHALHKRVRRRRPPTGPGPASVRPLPRPCEIKKLYKVPDFPSKRLPNWRTRGLEQRRQGLEAYIQGILYLNQEVPKELLEFLRLRHFPTDLKHPGGVPASREQLPAAPAACPELPYGSLCLHPLPRAAAQRGGEWCAPGPLQLQHQPR